MRDRGLERALGRERADVQLVQHELADRGRAPAAVGPRERARVEQPRGPAQALRLPARARVGERDAVQQVLVVGARRGFDDGLEHAQPGGLERVLDARPRAARRAPASAPRRGIPRGRRRAGRRRGGARRAGWLRARRAHLPACDRVQSKRWGLFSPLSSWRGRRGADHRRRHLGHRHERDPERHRRGRDDRHFQYGTTHRRTASRRRRTIAADGSVQATVTRADAEHHVPLPDRRRRRHRRGQDVHARARTRRRRACRPSTGATSRRRARTSPRSLNPHGGADDVLLPVRHEHALRRQTPNPSASAGSGTTAVTVAAALTGLRPVHALPLAARSPPTPPAPRAAPTGRSRPRGRRPPSASACRARRSRGAAD